MALVAPVLVMALQQGVTMDTAAMALGIQSRRKPGARLIGSNVGGAYMY